MKNKTRTVAFRPDEDVENMLKKAQENGLTPTEVLNNAVREYGQAVIRGLAARQSGWSCSWGRGALKCVGIASSWCENRTPGTHMPGANPTMKTG
jgi:hypothetical protein